MKVVVYIYLVMIFFVYLILCSIIFMTVKGHRDSRIERKVRELSKIFGKKIVTHIDKLKNSITLSSTEIQSVESKLKNKVYQKVFNNTIIAINEDPTNHPYVKKYMNGFEKYIRRLIKTTSKDGSIKNVYVAFLMGQYKVDHDYVNKFLLDSLQTPSLYLRFNALNSISQIGNAKSFVEALRYISAKDVYLDDKILVDIIDEFGGDMKKLDEKLIEDMDNFSRGIQCIIISHFKNVNNAFVASILCHKLSFAGTDKEVKVSIIKYFEGVHYLPAKRVLINLLDSQQWECRAIAAKTLGKYYSFDTVKKLLSTITDSNWYVRLNSAMSLLDFELGEKIIHYISKKDDKYSREVFLYAMFVKNKITYEEFVQRANMKKGDLVC